jgi:hypothetical protein
MSLSPSITVAISVGSVLVERWLDELFAKATKR